MLILHLHILGILLLSYHSSAEHTPVPAIILILWLFDRRPFYHAVVEVLAWDYVAVDGGWCMVEVGFESESGEVSTAKAGL